jgi:TPR repeat protein
MKNHSEILGSALLILSVQAVEAQDFDAAMGLYLQRQYEHAYEQFLPLANDGDARSQTQLALMYEFGYGVDKDNSASARWYRLAAEQGAVLAQSNLGYMFAMGKGVPQNYKEAIRWYRLAVDQGHAPAMYGLGILFDHSLHDAVSAYMWYNLSVANGSYGSIERDALLKTLDTNDVLRAQDEAQKCFDSGYKECEIRD